MENYLIFDLVILFFLILSALFSFSRGFSLESLSVINWILSFAGSYSFGDKSVNFINKFLNNLILSNAVSYILTFIFFFFIFSLLTKKVSETVKKSSIGILDRTGGFFFGIIRGYLIISVCFFCFHFFFNDENIDWVEKSKFNFLTLVTNEKIVNFFEKEGTFAKKLKEEIDEKSEKLFEKSVDSQIKLKKLIDKDKKIYNENDKNSLDYLIENSN